ncbi:MAG: RecX family transcriptional regulator [Bacteroidetes bacterium]|nr:RecX family transcriptional regulator [Bacteroidota bacterium]
MSTAKGRSFRVGTITALNPQVKNRARTSVFIDGEYAFGILTDLVVQNKLHVGKELNETEVSVLLQDEGMLRAKSKALGYLAYAPRTAYQIRTRLRERGFSDHEIDHTMGDLQDLGYIDDRKYAMEYATARFNHKGYGPERIRRELIADGVSHDDISEAIKATINPEAFAARAKSMVERFQTRVQGTFPERKKKLITYLTRRGYGYIMASEFVQEVLSQSESSKNRT